MADKQRIHGDIGPRHLPPVPGPIGGLDIRAILGSTERRFPAVRIDPQLSRVVGSARRTRPMLTIRDGAAEVDGPPWIDKLAMLGPAIAAVCKINPDRGQSATGVLLRDDLILTNEHVAARLRISERAQVNVRFGGESDGYQELSIAELVAADDELDVAVLRLERGPVGVTPPAFALDALPVAGLEVAAVGYPAFFMPGAGNASDVLADQLLGGPGVRGRKRVSPGLIRAVSDNLLRHDCSTAHGSSGSPLVDLATGIVIGVHAGGGRGPEARLNRAAPMAASSNLSAVRAAVGGDD